MTTAAEIDAARLLLTHLGLTPEQLIDAASPTEVPTFSEYITVLRESIPATTLRVYDTYFRRIEEEWGDRVLSEATAAELRQLAERTKHAAVVRRNSRGGRSAAESLIAAARCIYSHAEEAGYIRPDDNPARRVAKPRRLTSTRRAISDQQLADIVHTAATTGDDPNLDTMLLRLHIETACRRSGALALRPQDLDADQCLIFLREKAETVRWQPVSPTLMRAMLNHITERHGDHPVDTEPLFRRRNGTPVTRRRYDSLWKRIGKNLEWVERQQITAHWLRHTTLTWVERHFGYAVARAFAGHAEPDSRSGQTATYIRASLQEVAEALAAMTGEPHPLAA
ncbi:site-specific integrase [Nocardia terpenica]|uniref:tyrosine-type recombinase/integrase n=1 Tax=Nocardia terpenica TaxID=455432 RepID=UPI0018946EE9|nr:site-specific integrase [Nocardia terpenica]MBF6064673.1 site-specific integrase [Nocardia terpenica]MBF6107189.1 site-specific integrase [Nocardia terpenica]MBF6114947.1 site-specific integrase [Nocardia terpenica]MBF6122052.1 site-specific integrase [Nocardia terpenica]MBF6154435.1 site-specific integrase [Nocardia terpenica]